MVRLPEDELAQFATGFTSSPLLFTGFIPAAYKIALKSPNIASTSTNSAHRIYLWPILLLKPSD